LTAATQEKLLFIQGGSDGAHREDAKLVASLREALGPRYRVRYPRMPGESDPDYSAWKARIARELSGLGTAILVGHSIGASVIAKFLTEKAPRPDVAGIFLIATPFWHDHEVWRWADVELPPDASSRFPVGIPIYLYHGQDDEVVPSSHLDMYAGLLPHAVVRRLPGRNHQLNDDLSEVARDIEGVGDRG
jgi:hypothetical protein